MSTPLPIAEVPGHPGVFTITLEPNQGPMVVLDDALIRRLELALNAFPKSAVGMILASGSPRVFVAGADLKQIEGLDVPALEQYLAFGQRVFGLIARLGCPTVAAINGAALGGGLELAMHCDGLVASGPPSKDGQPGRPYPIGLPEAGLCICPGWGGTNLLPARMDPAEAIQRTAAGQTMMIDEAQTKGLLDAFTPNPADLISTAANWLRHHGQPHLAARRDGFPARWIGRPAGKSRVMAAVMEVRDEIPATDQARACLAAVLAGLEHGWPAALDIERRELNRLRHEPAGRAAIKAFFEKTAKK